MSDDRELMWEHDISKISNFEKWTLWITDAEETTTWLVGSIHRVDGGTLNCFIECTKSFKDFMEKNCPEELIKMSSAVEYTVEFPTHLSAKQWLINLVRLAVFEH